MNSYGAIRNMGLIYANLKGYDNVIQIDDEPGLLSQVLGKIAESLLIITHSQALVHQELLNGK